MLLARTLAERGPLRVLDVMAGCGIRSLRYGLEAGAGEIWANDADPDRLPLLRTNLAGLPAGVRWRASPLTAQALLADCLVRRQRFDLVDLDAFGCPTALVPLALEAVAFGGVLLLASSDGRSPTGHDRPAALRRFGAAARAHPASWEMALRLQLGVLARSAWALGRGLEPLFAFSEGRTFRSAVRLRRSPSLAEQGGLGMVAHCHGCGDQQVQSLLRLGRWSPCGCPVPGTAPLVVSGPLWIGPLQDPPILQAMVSQAGVATEVTVLGESLRLLERLKGDPGSPARCWPMAEIGRRLGAGPPPLAAIVEDLRAAGHRACSSGIMVAQLRSDAPWPTILACAQRLTSRRAAR